MDFPCWQRMDLEALAWTFRDFQGDLGAWRPLYTYIHIYIYTYIHIYIQSTFWDWFLVYCQHSNLVRVGCNWKKTSLFLRILFGVSECILCAAEGSIANSTSALGSSTVWSNGSRQWSTCSNGTKPNWMRGKSSLHCTDVFLLPKEKPNPESSGFLWHFFIIFS